MADSYVHAGAFELRFWLQVLGDHGRFIHQALASTETEALRESRHFIQSFDALLSDARMSLSNDEIQRLSQLAYELSVSLRKFKFEIIEKQLMNQMTIHITPSFINHMANELEEFIRVLEYLKEGKAPPLMHEVHHHLLWLQDAYGHSASLHSSLDMVDYELLEKTDSFTQTFKELYLKAEEMAGFLRTDVDEFPALSRFNRDVDIKMTIFKTFLNELEEMELKGEILDIVSPLITDHMGREECYYLIKLAESKGVSLPNCDPTRPRVEK